MFGAESRGSVAIPHLDECLDDLFGCLVRMAAGHRDFSSKSCGPDPTYRSIHL